MLIAFDELLVSRGFLHMLFKFLINLMRFILVTVTYM